MAHEAAAGTAREATFGMSLRPVVAGPMRHCRQKRSGSRSRCKARSRSSRRRRRRCACSCSRVPAHTARCLVPRVQVLICHVPTSLIPALSPIPTSLPPPMDPGLRFTDATLCASPMLPGPCSLSSSSSPMDPALLSFWLRSGGDLSGGDGAPRDPVSASDTSPCSSSGPPAELALELAHP